MTDTPGEHLDEEPQEERGAPGSRDTGSDEPSGGPAERASGASDKDSATTVSPQSPDDESPHLQPP